MIDELEKLSGMIYKNEYYTPGEWKNKTGVDPRKYPEYIKINKNNLCLWTQKAEELHKTYLNCTKNNWNSLGILS